MTPSRLYRDDRGAAATEYVLVVALVALVSSSAFLALGVALARSFTTARAYVLYPVP